MKLILIAALGVALAACKSAPAGAKYNAAKSRLEEIARNLGAGDYDLSEAKNADLAMQASREIAKGEAEVAAIIAEGKIPKDEARRMVERGRKEASASRRRAMEEQRVAIENLKKASDEKKAKDELERLAQEESRRVGQATIAAKSAADDAETAAEIAKLDVAEGMTPAEKQEAKSRINRRRVAKKLADARKLRQLELETSPGGEIPTK